MSHDFLLRRVLPLGRDARLKSLRQNVHRSRLYKVMVVGEVNTGKSALVRRYVHNFFSDRGSYRATLGVDFQVRPEGGPGRASKLFASFTFFTFFTN